MAANKRVFKTKQVVSGVRSEYRAWNDWDEGDVLVCKLTGSSPNKKNPSKKDWLVEPIDAFFSDKKEQKRVLGAKILTLNSAGQLDKGLQQAEMGQIIQVTYNGSKIMEGGNYKGQPAHTMQVDFGSYGDDEGAEDQTDGDEDESEDEDEEFDDGL